MNKWLRCVEHRRTVGTFRAKTLILRFFTQIIAVFMLIFELSVFVRGYDALAFDLPKQLNSQDRKEVVRTLGMGTSTKMLSNPYPLGGYSGFELGLALEFIDTTSLERLGCAATEPGCPNRSDIRTDDLSIFKASVGKGLYLNVDVFLDFMFPLKGDQLSDFGGMIRWSFYQAKFLPIILSTTAHAHQFNFKDAFLSQTLGMDLYLGINLEQLAFYLGGGILQTKGTFTAGNQGSGVIQPNDPHINGATYTTSEMVYGNHIVVGATLTFEQIFISAQIDRYRDPVFSSKIGFRM